MCPPDLDVDHNHTASHIINKPASINNTMAYSLVNRNTTSFLEQNLPLPLPAYRSIERFTTGPYNEKDEKGPAQAFIAYRAYSPDEVRLAQKRGVDITRDEEVWNNCQPAFMVVVPVPMGLAKQQSHKMFTELMAQRRKDTATPATSSTPETPPQVDTAGPLTPEEEPVKQEA